MHLLRTLTSRLPSLASFLSIALLASLTSCNGVRADGSLGFVGILYIILAVAALLSLLKQDWDLTKKLIWGAVIWFFPFGGSIIYFLFSGRK